MLIRLRDVYLKSEPPPAVPKSIKKVKTLMKIRKTTSPTCLYTGLMAQNQKPSGLKSLTHLSMAAVLALLVAQPQIGTSDDISWNPPSSGSGGSSSWNNATNWTGGVPENDLSTDIVVFGGTSAYNFQPVLDAFTVQSINGVRLGGASTVSTTLSALNGSRTTSGETLGNSSTITLADATGVVVGQHITGNQIFIGTFVTDVSGNTITLSRNTSGGTINDAVALTFNSSLKLGNAGITLLADTPNVTNLITAPIALGANQVWNNQSTRNMLLQGSIYLDAHTLTLNGVAGSEIRFDGASGTQSIGGTGNIIVDTAGNVRVGPGSGDRQQNSFTGGVTLENGRITLNGGNAGGSGGMGGLGTGVFTINGGELAGGGNIAGHALTISGQVWNAEFGFAGGKHIDMGVGEISLGTTAGSSRTLTANGDWTILTLGGGIVNGTTANQFILAGSSTVELKGESSYTGGTLVSGTSNLMVNNTAGSGTGSGEVTVQNGATLSGTGSIDGGVLVNAGGVFTGTLSVGGNSTIAGNHRPGNSPGIQNFDGNLTYTTGAAVEWELASNTNVNQPNPDAIFDTLLVGGDLNFADTTSLNLVFNSAESDVDWNDAIWSTDKIGTDGWLLYDVAGSLSNFSNLSLVTADWLDSNSTELSSVKSGADFGLYQDGTNIYVTYSIPEPSSLILIGLAGLAGILSMKRRRKN